MSYVPRKHTRFRLKVPVTFSWRDERGSRRRARGYTRDLGPGGMYLTAPRCPPPGTAVGLEAYLPPLSPIAPYWLMQARGRVVRVESEPNSEGLAGFAAVSEEVTLKAVEQAA